MRLFVYLKKRNSLSKYLRFVYPRFVFEGGLMSPFIQFQFSSNPTYLKVTEVVLTLRERGHELQ